MSEPLDPADPRRDDEGDDARDDDGLAGLTEMLRSMGMPMPPGGLAGLGGPGGMDLQAMIRGMFGPDAQLPPEFAQLAAALAGDPSGNPMAAMAQQAQALFGSRSGSERLATATDLARKVTAMRGDRSIGESQRREVEQAVAVARLWLDPVTALDSPAGPALAWSAAEWVEATMPRWYSLVEPIGDGVAAAGAVAMRKQLDQLRELGGADAGSSDELAASLGLPAGMGAMLGPMLSQLGPALEQFAAGMFGAQLGQGVGALAADVLSGTEVGLPLLDEGVVALMPTAIAAFASGLDIDLGQVRLYLAVREAARVRLYAEVPWLAAQVEAAVRDYGRNVSIDTDAIEAAIRSVDVTNLTDIESLQQAMSQTELFGRTTTPAQQAALVRLETTLALVEGWVDLVTDQAVAAHLPQAGALGEMVRRRRAGGPAQKTFAVMVGLELRPRRLRDARNLWAALQERGGLVLRDGSWAHPDLAPTSADLDDPLGYVERRANPPAPDAMDAELDALLAGFAPGQTGAAGSDAPRNPETLGEDTDESDESDDSDGTDEPGPGPGAGPGPADR